MRLGGAEYLSREAAGAGREHRPWDAASRLYWNQDKTIDASRAAAPQGAGPPRKQDTPLALREPQIGKNRGSRLVSPK